MVNAHEYYLEELVNNLSQVGENFNDVKYYFKEGIYRPLKGRGIVKFCDLILIYHRKEGFESDYGVPIELKGSFKKRRKALEQLANGASFVREELGLPVPYGKFVVYQKGSYLYENRSIMNGGI